MSEKDDPEYWRFIATVLRKARFVKDASELPEHTVRVCVPYDGIKREHQGLTWCSKCGQPCTYNQDEIALTDSQRPLCIPCMMRELEQ
jgi:hypothetical protein